MIKNKKFRDEIKNTIKKYHDHQLNNDTDLLLENLYNNLLEIGQSSVDGDKYYTDPYELEDSYEYYKDNGNLGSVESLIVSISKLMIQCQDVLQSLKIKRKKLKKNEGEIKCLKK